MTWFILGCLAGSIALAGALGGGLIWAAKRSSDLARSLVKATEGRFQAELKEIEATRELELASLAVKDLEASLGFEVSARKKAEEHAEKAIDELIKTGNAPAAASRLRSDLERLRALSKVPDVPGAAAPNGG